MLSNQSWEVICSPLLGRLAEITVVVVASVKHSQTFENGSDRLEEYSGLLGMLLYMELSCDLQNKDEVIRESIYLEAKY